MVEPAPAKNSQIADDMELINVDAIGAGVLTIWRPAQAWVAKLPRQERLTP